jgi:hypothetical protein
MTSFPPFAPNYNPPIEKIENGFGRQAVGDLVGVGVVRQDPEEFGSLAQKGRQEVDAIDPVLPAEADDLIHLSGERVAPIQIDEQRINDQLESDAPLPAAGSDRQQVGLRQLPASRRLRTEKVSILNVGNKLPSHFCPDDPFVKEADQPAVPDQKPLILLHPGGCALVDGDGGVLDVGVVQIEGDHDQVGIQAVTVGFQVLLVIIRGRRRLGGVDHLDRGGGILRLEPAFQELEERSPVVENPPAPGKGISQAEDAIGTCRFDLGIDVFAQAGAHDHDILAPQEGTVFTDLIEKGVGWRIETLGFLNEPQLLSGCPGIFGTFFETEKQFGARNGNQRP